jgi:hypothetical protein
MAHAVDVRISPKSTLSRLIRWTIAMPPQFYDGVKVVSLVLPDQQPSLPLLGTGFFQSARLIAMASFFASSASFCHAISK